MCYAIFYEMNARDGHSLAYENRSVMDGWSLRYLLLRYTYICFFLF